MKMLVIAFPRSGTTLTQRVLRSHPEVKRMFFETNHLKKIGTSRERILNNLFPEGQNIGEKVIYEKDVMGKRKNTDITPVDYCKLWNKRFKKEARILQIVRHPYDVWNSILLKKYIKRDLKNAIIKMEKAYFTHIPEYFSRISNFPNCLTIKYEDLVMNSKEMNSKIYEHCGLSPHMRYEDMRSSRVFAYKRKGLVIQNDKRLKNYKTEFMKIMDENIDIMLETLNNFAGVKYVK